MLIGVPAVHFCDAVTSIPSVGEPKSECPLPSVSFHPPLQDNYVRQKIIVASEWGLHCILYIYCAVRVMSEPSDCCWKVETDKCSLRNVLPLLAGCSIREKSPHPECLLIAPQICCYSVTPAGSAATDSSSKGMCNDVTQHNMSSWVREALTHPFLSLPFHFLQCSTLPDFNAVKSWTPEKSIDFPFSLITHSLL